MRGRAYTHVFSLLGVQYFCDGPEINFVPELARRSGVAGEE